MRVHACVVHMYLDVCMGEGVVCVNFSDINTVSNRTRTTVKISREDMAQMVEWSLTM